MEVKIVAGVKGFVVSVSRSFYYFTGDTGQPETYEDTLGLVSSIPSSHQTLAQLPPYVWAVQTMDEALDVCRKALEDHQRKTETSS